MKDRRAGLNYKTKSKSSRSWCLLGCRQSRGLVSAEKLFFSLVPYSAALTRHYLCLLGFSSLSFLLLLSMLGSVGRFGRTGNSVSSRSTKSILDAKGAG